MLNMQYLKRAIWLFGIIGTSLLANSATGSVGQKEPFYTCEQGFKFESKSQSARCIKEKRLSHRPPKKCPQQKGYKLAVDRKGVTDLCISTGAKQAPSGKLQPVAPGCTAGYRILTRKGKDSCVKEQKQAIKPPTKKVRR